MYRSDRGSHLMTVPMRDRDFWKMELLQNLGMMGRQHYKILTRGTDGPKTGYEYDEHSPVEVCLVETATACNLYTLRRVSEDDNRDVRVDLSHDDFEVLKKRLVGSLGEPRVAAVMNDNYEPFRVEA